MGNAHTTFWVVVPGTCKLGDLSGNVDVMLMDAIDKIELLIPGSFSQRKRRLNEDREGLQNCKVMKESFWSIQPYKNVESNIFPIAAEKNGNPKPK